MNLKRLGNILLVLSTIAATLCAARTPVLEFWFGASCLAMVSAVLMLRLGARPPKAGSRQAAEAAFDFTGCLGEVNSALEKLAGERELSCERIHRELDRLSDGPLFDFARYREQLVSVAGYASFARLVGEFTRAERSLNRAWSAAVDGYREEALESMNRARDRFVQLGRLLDDLNGLQGLTEINTSLNDTSHSRKERKK